MGTHLNFLLRECGKSGVNDSENTVTQEVGRVRDGLSHFTLGALSLMLVLSVFDPLQIQMS